MTIIKRVIKGNGKKETDTDMSEYFTHYESK
jgi:tRNA G46 methylase TrmB